MSKKLTNKPRRVYTVLEQDLRKEILNGNLKERKAIRPECDLASEYGISRNSVRKALDNLMQEGLLYRIQGSGTFVVPAERRNFYANSTMKQLKSRQILFLMLESSISKTCFAGEVNNYEAVYDGLSRALHPNGYNLLFAHVGLDWQPPECLLGDDVCGILFHGKMPFEFWEKYIKQHPNVGLQYDDPSFETSWVKIDNFKRSYQALAYLKKLGHRRIGFISNECEMQLPAERFAGYLSSLQKLNLPYNSSWAINWQRPFENGVLANENIQQASNTPWLMERLQEIFHSKDHPTAFICLDDGRVLQFMNTLAQLGLKVPDDISLTGGFNSLPAFPMDITGLCDRFPEVCFEGAKLLREIIESDDYVENKTVLLQPQLHIGDTTSEYSEVAT